MDIEWGWDNARAIMGLFVIIGDRVGSCPRTRSRFSMEDRDGAPIVMIVIVLFTLPMLHRSASGRRCHPRRVLDGVNNGINVLIAATREGTAFVFGPVIGDQAALGKACRRRRARSSSSSFCR